LKQQTIILQIHREFAPNSINFKSFPLSIINFLKIILWPICGYGLPSLFEFKIESLFVNENRTGPSSSTFPDNEVRYYSLKTKRTSYRYFQELKIKARNRLLSELGAL
jgi:hypothetical protein